MTFMSFRARALALAAVAALTLYACGGGGGDSPATPPETLSVALTADQEVATPAVVSGAFGAATLTLDRANRVLSGTVTVDGVTPTLAHIHPGAAGTNGPVLFDMTVNAGGATLPPTTLTSAQLASLDAGEFYINVHSVANPGGEIRGQVNREVYTAVLSGAQENPSVATAASGTGRVVLDPVTRAITAEINVSGLSPTMAHIHVGAAGVNGPIIVDFQNAGGGRFAAPAGAVLTEAQVASLRAGGLYFNAHTAANPGGEIRGQIGRRVLRATVNGAQEVPANSSTATGSGTIVYDPFNRMIQGGMTLTGIAATMAHIHTGAIGVNGPISVDLVETAAGSGVWNVPANRTVTAEQARALLSNGTYFNAHSVAFPGGEIRGQLSGQ